MEIEKIIYNTTREIYSVEDKLSIATVFLFCYSFNEKLFADLLYTDNHDEFIEKLNSDYSNYDTDFTIRLNDKNVRNSFYKTLEKVKEKYDDNGFYKALFDRDEFALMISKVLCYDCYETLSNISKITKFNNNKKT